MKQSLLSLGIVGVVALYSTPGASQSDRGFTLQEITVTARRTEESLQSTPIAITAVSGAELEERGATRIDAVGDFAPNVNFSFGGTSSGSTSAAVMFIRGVGQNDFLPTTEPGVGLYVDGVYYGRTVGSLIDLLDLERVEVLRGPQGTLFGRNTIGGAILLTTTDPGDEFGGKVRIGTGTDSLMDGFIALDAPVSNTLKARFSFGIRKQDGYVERTDGTDLGDTDTFTGMTKWLWSPSDKVHVTFAGDYAKSDENGSPLVFAAMTETATFPRVASLDAGCPGLTDGAVPPPGIPDQPAVPMIQDDRCANDLQARGPFRNNGTFPLESTVENWGTSLKVAADVTDNLQFKSISAYRDIRWTGARDADNTPLTILHTLYDVQGGQFSQELQLTYQTEPLIGVFGLYYFEQTSDDIATVELNPPPPGIQRDSDNNKVDNNSWAVFTQWTYNVTDKLSITGGGRYTEDDKGSYPDQFDLSTPNNKQVAVRWYRDTFSSFTPSGSIAYRWTDNAMTYVSYSEGFKGGGWNSHFNDPPLSAAEQASLQEFRPEEAQTVELGTKLEFADTVRLNLAVFTSDYTDMQVTYRGPFRVPPAMSGVAPFITNAGKASIDGAEAELTWQLSPQWSIDASMGYLDATIDRLQSQPLAIIPPGLVAGNRLPFAPEWQGHVGVEYSAHAGTMVIRPRVDASYQDMTFFDATNTREIAQLDDVTTVNAQVQISGDGGPWRVTLGVNNATDELYPIAGNSSLTTGSGYAEIAYARPREWFANFQYEF